MVEIFCCHYCFCALRLWPLHHFVYVCAAGAFRQLIVKIKSPKLNWLSWIYWKQSHSDFSFTWFLLLLQLSKLLFQNDRQNRFESWLFFSPHPKHFLLQQNTRFLSFALVVICSTVKSVWFAKMFLWTKIPLLVVDEKSIAEQTATYNGNMRVRMVRLDFAECMNRRVER